MVLLCSSEPVERVDAMTCTIAAVLSFNTAQLCPSLSSCVDAVAVSSCSPPAVNSYGLSVALELCTVKHLKVLILENLGLKQNNTRVQDLNVRLHSHPEGFLSWQSEILCYSELVYYADRSTGRGKCQQPVTGKNLTVNLAAKPLARLCPCCLYLSNAAKPRKTPPPPDCDVAPREARPKQKMNRYIFTYIPPKSCRISRSHVRYFMGTLPCVFYS